MSFLNLIPGTRAAADERSALARRVATALVRKRPTLARRLKEGIAGWAKYDSVTEQNCPDYDDYLREQFYAFVDYLARYLDSGDDAYRQLYIGEKLKLLYDPSLDTEADYANRRRVTDADIEALCGPIRGELGAEGAELLETILRDAQRVILARCGKHMEVLWIGDCLFLDVRGFLASRALEEGITYHPTFVGSRVAPQQREQIRALADRKFDLIFYSPVTYHGSTALIQFERLKQSLMSRRRILQVVDEEMAEFEKTLDLIATTFEVPTYVHNTANIRRHDGLPLELAKVLATRRSRGIVRKAVNARVAAKVASMRSQDANVILFDETGILQKYGEVALGRQAYFTRSQHPAVLGRMVAGRYAEILAAHAYLVGKKVVVCDLDNTLWKGEIGEGAVEHFPAIQGPLRELRRKGVLLTINSKNDPGKVHWNGALLDAEDFVDTQINWESKVANMRRTQQALNLKFKDFVFLDDRADQRELVHEAIPEILVLDSTSPTLAARLKIWADALPDNPETDRTKQYREREQRESFLAEAGQPEEDPTAAFARLEIRCTIRDATTAELKRVAELINRTNQFNMTGSRTTLKQVREWVETPGRRVIVAEAGDKFGPMGVVSVLMVDASGPVVEIPAFVLSCRVFGYGIEDAILNALRRRAAAAPAREAKAIRGPFVETPHNAPCRETYPRNGFVHDGTAWVLADPGSPVDPSWLTVTDSLG